MPVEEKNTSQRMGVRPTNRLRDEILVARRHAGAAFAAAALHAIFGERRALDVAGMGDGDGDVLALDQRLVLDLDFGVDQFGLARRWRIRLRIAAQVRRARSPARAAARRRISR